MKLNQIQFKMYKGNTYKLEVKIVLLNQFSGIHFKPKIHNLLCKFISIVLRLWNCTFLIQCGSLKNFQSYWHKL